MQVCAYVCTCACMRVCPCVRVSVRVYVRVYAHAYVSTCACVRVCVCLHVRAYQQRVHPWRLQCEAFRPIQFRHDQRQCPVLPLRKETTCAVQKGKGNRGMQCQYRKEGAGGVKGKEEKNRRRRRRRRRKGNQISKGACFQRLTKAVKNMHAIQPMAL